MARPVLGWRREDKTMPGSLEHTRLHDRHMDGEMLYFKLGRDAHDALVVAPSCGGIEIAYPTGYLVSKALTWITAPLPDVPMPKPRTAAFTRWAAAIDAEPHEFLSSTRTVVLMDDGCLPVDQLVALTAALRNAGPGRLIVAAPWLHPDARSAVRALADKVVTLFRTAAPIEYGPPMSVAHALGDLASVAGRWGAKPVRRRRAAKGGPAA